MMSKITHPCSNVSRFTLKSRRGCTTVHGRARKSVHRRIPKDAVKPVIYATYILENHKLNLPPLQFFGLNFFFFNDRSDAYYYK